MAAGMYPVYSMKQVLKQNPRLVMVKILKQMKGSIGQSTADGQVYFLN